MLAIETTEVTTASNLGLVFNHEQWLEVQYQISKWIKYLNGRTLHGYWPRVEPRRQDGSKNESHAHS
jgi:hypothetical protein